MICPDCKAEMKYFVEGNSCGWKCSECSVEIVTTYNDPIMLDENEYVITIRRVDHPNASQIKLAAEICQSNYLISKERLLEGFSTSTMKAKDARYVLSKLKAANLAFDVSPDFEYEY
ncbi:hypothetical protein SAMN02910370_02207 [Lachnospiraceae bacterium XPB1003]|nr:hypothetical protein SAMN02910370_02207 [Lachnospiraceae bacterium XPB1003]